MGRVARPGGRAARMPARSTLPDCDSVLQSGKQEGGKQAVKDYTMLLTREGDYTLHRIPDPLCKGTS